MSNSRLFRALRDELLRRRSDYDGACRDFSWPRFSRFNWARDYFDVIAQGNEQPALRVVDDEGADQSDSFATVAQRSRQVAAFMAALGVTRGDRVLIMLPNCIAL